MCVTRRRATEDAELRRVTRPQKTKIDSPKCS